MVTAPRFFRTQPSAGEIAPEAQAEFSGIAHMPGSRPFTPPSFYSSDGDYSQMMPIRPAVDTPPLTAEDALSLGTRRSSPARWASPAPRSVPMNVQGNVRVCRPPRSRRRRSKKDRAEGASQLPGPLSELTKHMTHIPIRDMEAQVNRPIEVRRQEALRKGRVVRPMNSFMLYRSAYAERTKEWCEQNNHQVVSKICGWSWPLEPNEIREKYERLALKERDNHLLAHPQYRFKPTKNPSKKTPASSVNGDESTDLDDFASPSSLMGHQGSAEVDSAFNSRGSTPLDTPESSFAGSYSSSPWQMGRSFPTGMMTPPEPAHHLIPSSIHQSVLGAHVEDVPFQDIQFTSALAGLPGSAHHDLLQPQTSAPAPGQAGEGQLDPQLLFHHGQPSTGVDGHGYNHNSNNFPYAWQEHPTASCYLPMTAALTPNTMQAYQVLEPSYSSDIHAGTDGRDAWSLSYETSFDDSKEFDRWFDPQSDGY
ncbi:hypothetical protein MPDQ_002336 [Monascus purpureus]|uniref:HMG box domain-containing protein n=1 Tax=Monascus purpureus TaxID=5098 RepID=A0A507QKT0_MONPU|nr:hypothetical protein MPDQ_002336 [Monascus purpureus]